MSKHTPGPWSVHRDFKNYVVPADHASRRVGFAVDETKDLAEFAQQVCEINLLTRRRPASESIANAHLIAAAPELLEMAEFLAEALEEGHWQETKEQLRELISKAKGEA